MRTTIRLIKRGNALEVRIPRHMLPAEMPDAAQIDWHNGVWTIRPVYQRSLAGLTDVFAAFPADFMVGAREFHEQIERDGSGFKRDPPAR